jgi:hypothetical protein
MNKRKAAITILFALILTSVFVTPAMAVDLDAPLPAEVITDPYAEEVRKVYELPKSADQRTLPVGDFERGGYIYECVDVIREEIANEDSKEYSEIFTAESKTKDDATVAELMPQTREITTEDGYSGELKLNTATVKAEATGYTNSTRTLTTTREYPNLGDQDIANLPKTVETGGRTYTLSDVQWVTDNTANVDDYETGDRYKAIVTYSTEQTIQNAKGYIISGTYGGTVIRTKDATIRYTVIFAKNANAVSEPESAAGTSGNTGISIPVTSGSGTAASETSDETPVSSANNGGSVLLLLIGFIIAAAGLVGCLILLIFKTDFFNFNRVGGHKYDMQNNQDSSAPVSAAPKYPGI